MSVFFKDHQVETVKRVEVYSYTDFMAICGGLLGLFLGISILSIIEFIYYFTLRLFWTIRRSNNNNVVIPFKPRTVEAIHNNSDRVKPINSTFGC